MASDKCSYNFLGQRLCNEKPYEKGGLCIFHSWYPDKTEQFENQLNAQIANRDYDFRGYVFPKEFKLDLSDATFQENPSVYIMGTAFKEFKGSVDFTSAIFQENARVDFSGATFLEKAKVYFKGATFLKGARVDFTSAKFQENVSVNFIGATFQKEARVDFPDAKFQENAKVYFADATIGRLDLRTTLFEGVADFRRAQFSNPVVFEKWGFGEGSTFKEADLALVTFRRCDLSKCSFRDAYHINEAEFDTVTWASMPPNLRRPKPLGSLIQMSRWTGPPGKALARLAQWDLPAGKTLDWLHHRLGEQGRGVIYDDLVARRTDKGEDYAATERVYRQLKASYEKHRDYPTAGDFYYGEMDMRRLGQGRWRRYFCLHLLYLLSSGYGQQWRKAGAWFVVIVVLFAWLHALAGFQLVRPDPAAAGAETVWLIRLWSSGDFWRGLGESILYSLRTATLLRDAAAAPLSLWGNFLVWLESVLGPLLLGLMALAIRRKFQR